MEPGVCLESRCECLFHLIQTFDNADDSYQLTQQFRFRTRMQRLNSLSADARASLNYLEQLQKFHAQQGHARVSIPVVDRRPVDLYNLRLIVNKMGGYEAIARSRNWANVTRKLGYDEKDAGHLAAQIKAAYTRIILPFEKFLQANKETAEAQRGRRASRSPEQRYNGNASMSPSSSGGFGQAQTAPAHQTSFAAAAAQFEADANEVDRSLDDLDSSNKRRSTRKRYDPSKSSALALLGKDNDSAKKKFVVVPGAEEQMCEICLRGDNGTAMLLCDDCNRGYHMYCLDPPLTVVPKSQWYCPPCLVGTGNDYGFEDGDTHSLSSFWNRAESFRAAWWSRNASHIWKPEGKTNGLTRPVVGARLHVSEDDVEREFWRLVHNPDENVEVEYGADIHSTTHGSALPTVETFPLSPYARDSWNLNNLPILPDSLLRYIRSDISGMTVPWLYVGMIFSTFCWHIEDHHTYSINYQHFGDTKTWYGVPGSDAHLLEEALKAAAPDLFEQSPDLLDQLVTMMSPDKLKKHGVHVYACDQRANEFVVTYPRAYHSGFNHGFNVNEAVNFALPDWIDAGLESVKRYKQSHRSPVFSHDELLMTVYQQNQSVDAALWLQKSMNEMVKREINQRDQLRRLVPTISEVVELEEIEEGKARPEEKYQCAYCKVFCYLGQITSEKSQGVACLDHGNEVCGVDSPTKWVLRLRYSDEALHTLLAKTIERAAVPSMWQTKFNKLIVGSPRPALRNLRGLLTDGEKIPFEILELPNLKVFVKRANDWVDEATSFISRKHQKRSGVSKEPAPVSRRGKRGSKVMDEEEEVEEELGEQGRVYKLLEEVDELAFDAPEIAALRGVVNTMEDFNARAESIFKQVDKGLEPKMIECEELMSIGLSLNVKLPQLDPLQKYVGKRKWIMEVQGIRESFTNLEDVESFIQEGLSFNVSSQDALMAMLQERRDAGLAWKKKALAILGNDGKANGGQRFKMEDAEEPLRASYKVAIDPDLHVKIEALLKHVREWGRQCEGLVNAEKSSDPMDAYRKYLEASRLLKHMKDSTIIIKDKKKLRHMKDAQENSEVRLYRLLFAGNDKWEAIMVPDVANRMQKEYLDQLTECLADGNGTPCICHSTSSEKGVTNKCTKCSISYHIKCLGLDKKEGKDKEWVCPFCDPRKLSKLVAGQVNKKPLQEIREVLVEITQKQPWGESPTYRNLDKLLNMANSMPSLKAAPKDQPKKRTEMIKQLIHCPLRLVTKDSSKDPLIVLVEALYKDSGLDASGLEMVVKDTGPLPISSYKVPTIPPFRSASRDVAPAPVNGQASVPMRTIAPAPAPTSQQGNGTVSFNSQLDESQADITMMDDSGDDGPAAQGQSSSNKRGRSSMTSDERKRKRGKRAKFVFEEEVGIFVPVHGERIYCLCHQPETGTMISCERCSLWFHNTCVFITPETDLGDERWICPMCCVKTERKYPHAEVKVKAMGEIDPNLWIDVRATLRSTRGPVTKMQHWGSDPHKRIALHLESFYPATLPTAKDAAKDAAKRQKTSEGSPGPRHARGESENSQGDSLPHHPNALGSIARNPNWSDVKARVTPAHRTPLAEERARLAAEEAQERHKAGMANLYSRGVTDAMIQRWYVGWNGTDLVYPRKDRYGVFHELKLGPFIELGPDDPDGSILIGEKLAEEAERLRRELDIARGSSNSSKVEVDPRIRAPSPPMPSLGTPIRSVISSHQAPPPPAAWRNRPAQSMNDPRTMPPFARPLSRPSPPGSIVPRSPHRSTSSTTAASLVPPPLPPFGARIASASSGETVKSPSLPRAPTNNAHSSSSIHAPTTSTQSPHLNGSRPLVPSPRNPSAPAISRQSVIASSASSSPAPISSKPHSPSLRPAPPRSETPKETPDSALEEYRMLARKMKPNATDEEIEMMARHAMT
jgi:histone demethylase JARID1